MVGFALSAGLPFMFIKHIPLVNTTLHYGVWRVCDEDNKNCQKYEPTDCGDIGSADLRDQCRMWQGVQALVTLAAITSFLQLLILVIHCCRGWSSDRCVKPMTILLGLICVLSGIIGVILAAHQTFIPKDHRQYHACFYMTIASSVLTFIVVDRVRTGSTSGLANVMSTPFL